MSTNNNISNTNNQNNNNNSKARGWCFTINNPEKDQLFNELPVGYKFIIWQKEKGKENTIHLQGFLYAIREKSFNQIKKLLGERSHIEKIKGTIKQNMDYCSKSDTKIDGPWKLGEVPNEQGKRTDLQNECEKVLRTGSVKSVEPSKFVKYSSGFLKLQARIQAPYRSNLKIITLIGYTGLGKSFTVRDLFEDIYTPYYGNAGIWWDGYCENKVVCLEEYKAQLPLQKLLQILDPYPLQLECKGGCTPAHYTILFITSNSSPDQWYKNENNERNEELEALYRRTGYPNNSNYIHIKKSDNTINIDRHELRTRLYFALADAIPRPVKDCLKHLQEIQFTRAMEEQGTTVSNVEPRETNSLVNRICTPTIETCFLTSDSEDELTPPPQQK